MKPTLTVRLGGDESEAPPSRGAPAEETETPEGADAKGESGESEKTAMRAPAAEATADDAAAPNEAEESEAEREAAAAVEIPVVAPLVAPAEEIIALAPPNPALLQETSRGALPIIGPDGREPWREYGRMIDPAGEQPRLAVIVSGLGLSSDATMSAIRLPKEVTLSFTPYGAVG